MPKFRKMVRRIRAVHWSAPKPPDAFNTCSIVKESKFDRLDVPRLTDTYELSSFLLVAASWE